MAKKKADQSENSEEKVAPVLGYNAGTKIVNAPISDEMKQSYLDYAMSVITQRALPDARDGLKPVHRRILFSMHKNGLNYAAKFRKSASVVGDVIASYHPHGDTSVYDAMVKLAQPFATRYPLVFGQGNFGSIDGDPPAAYRYTEAKMSKLSGDLLKDIEKDTVNFRATYDGRTKEPVVLPNAIPGLLLNGTLGIAVGMASNIPPHNLNELMDAIVYLIDNPNASSEELFQFVKGPDYPTGGIIFNEKDIHHAYTHGRGGVVCRGESEIVELKSGAFQIVITSIPYRVNKSEMILKIADLVKDKKLEGIKDIRDESTDDIRVVIDIKPSAHPQNVLNYIYKHTQLEDTFHFNMVALVDGVPQTLSLKAALREFIKHRFEVVTRRTKFDLNKALDREHILIGLKKALDHIDEVIKCIRASKDTPTAKLNLMKQFKFSNRQADAILEMRLQKLAGLERKKIEDELKAVQALIKELKELLESEKKMKALVKKELAEIQEKYGDARRTKVVRHGVKNLSAEDLIPDDPTVIVLSKGGYIKRTDPNEYKQQRRGGVGVVDLNTKEEDFVQNFLSTTNHSDLLFFTDKGKVYQLKTFDIPEGRRATRGKSIANFLSIGQDERITSILPIPKEIKKSDSLAVFMITRNGVAKKVEASSFYDVRRTGIIAIGLKDDDALVEAMFTTKGDSVIVASKQGQSIRFKEADIREMGRTAAGVRGFNLKKGDQVISAGVVSKDFTNPRLFTFSSKGYGKQTNMDEYKVQNRGGSGIKTASITSKNGPLVAGKVITDEVEEVVAISKNGQVIRVALTEIPNLGRQTQGVRVMKLREGDEIASIVCF
jgi:DNA gyrase subunit A